MPEDQGKKPEEHPGKGHEHGKGRDDEHLPEPPPPPGIGQRKSKPDKHISA